MLSELAKNRPVNINVLGSFNDSFDGRSVISSCPDMSFINTYLEKDFQATALHYAAQLGDEEIIRALLDRGADVQAKDDAKSGGSTPLHVAVRFECVEALQILLQVKDIDIDAINANAKTAYELARELRNIMPPAQRGPYQAIMDALKKAGCLFACDIYAKTDPSVYDEQRNPEKKPIPITNAMIQRVRDQGGCYGFLEDVLQRLQAGKGCLVDVKDLGNSGKTALWYAGKLADGEIIEALFSWGAYTI